jgi:hypothetical protein
LLRISFGVSNAVIENGLVLRHNIALARKYCVLNDKEVKMGTSDIGECAQ